MARRKFSGQRRFDFYGIQDKVMQDEHYCIMREQVCKIVAEVVDEVAELWQDDGRYGYELERVVAVCMETGLIVNHDVRQARVHDSKTLMVLVKDLPPCEVYADKGAFRERLMV
ncbi:MAG: transposase, partial [Thermoplasmatales archaeon]